MQSNSVNGQPDIANITVVTDERQVIVPQAITSVVEVNNPGPQGPVGPQGEAGPSEPFVNIGNGVYTTTSSLQVTGSFLVSGSSTFTNIGPAIFSGSVNATSGVTMSSALVSGDVTVLGTASINVLQINTTINSTGSNQLGDSANDTQTLYGTVVIPTGSLTVSGSAKVNEGIFGIGTSGNILPLVNTAGTGTVVVGGTSPNTPSLRIQGSPLNFFIGSTQVAQMFTTTGNLLLQNGGTFTDAGYRLDVNGNTKIKGSGATSATTALRVENTNASASLVVLDNGAVGIGTTSPSSSILLDVSGSIRSFSILPTTDSTYNLGTTSLRYNYLFAKSVTAEASALDFNGTNIRLYINGTQRAILNSNGNFLLQNGGTFTDNGYQLQVNATGSNSGSLFLGGTTIATGSIARTMLISSSLSASANSDVLVGLDINPTFTTGAFTGVSTFGIRVSGSVRGLSDVQAWNGAASLSANSLSFNNTSTTARVLASSATTNLAFRIGSTDYAQFFNTTGNFLLQSGGTFTDNNYRLQVNATGSNSGSLFLGGTTIATGSIARTMLISSSLSASANNDVLVGLDINPSFDVGSFTGVERTAIRYGTIKIGLTPAGQDRIDFGNQVNISRNNGEAILTATTAQTFLSSRSSAAYVAFALNQGITEVGRFAATTGNFLIGTTTDAGAKLHISGSTSQALLIASSSTGPALYVSGSGNVGIGTSTPINTLDIVSTTTGSLRISGSAGSQITLVRPTAGAFGYVRYLGISMDIGTNSADNFRLNTNNTTRINIADTGFVGIGIGASTPSSLLQVRGSGATSATTTLLLQNSTPTNLLTMLDNGQVAFTSPTMSLAASQSAFSISPIISASNVVGGQYYGVSITPTFFQTTGSQTKTAFRVAATFTSSNATATTGSNIIADFGSTSAGSQLTVTDVTSGSIYMVNDVSGIPIIEATSNWNVNIYDFPNKVFEKTGSQINIYGTMRVSGSFILPLSQSVAPQTGSAYWSGSLLFIYDGTRYRSSSFA